jgi:hypothetical protein
MTELSSAPVKRRPSHRLSIERPQPSAAAASQPRIAQATPTGEHQSTLSSFAEDAHCTDLMSSEPGPSEVQHIPAEISTPRSQLVLTQLPNIPPQVWLCSFDGHGKKYTRALRRRIRQLNTSTTGTAVGPTPTLPLSITVRLY